MTAEELIQNYRALSKGNRTLILNALEIHWDYNRETVKHIVNGDQRMTLEQAIDLEKVLLPYVERGLTLKTVA